MKRNERKWSVDFNFFTKADGTRSCMNIQMGFATEAEAKAWADENTSYGEVHWYERIW